ncbi:unnamed protein product [Microthlaspi erraticum]|uniref:Uncharacterized protein n=1 Tax=Microthlaspi erraticum TaxID=1685480 RepID=A0A6D2ITY2_9BRAS|nr:unnamed protein product [Microthlaspi erraticum]
MHLHCCFSHEQVSRRCPSPPLPRHSPPPPLPSPSPSPYAPKLHPFTAVISVICKISGDLVDRILETAEEIRGPFDKTKARALRKQRELEKAKKPLERDWRLNEDSSKIAGTNAASTVRWGPRLLLLNVSTFRDGMFEIEKPLNLRRESSRSCREPPQNLWPVFITVKALPSFARIPALVTPISSTTVTRRIMERPEHLSKNKDRKNLQFSIITFHHRRQSNIDQ